MALESATWATQFDATFPQSSDPRSDGDDHLRMIKSVIQTELSAANRQWVYTGDAITWISSTAVTIPTDQTGTYEQGRRVKAVGSGTGTIYGDVSSSTFSATTRVSLRWDSGGLSNEAIEMYAGLLTPSNQVRPKYNRTGSLNSNALFNSTRLADAIALESDTTEMGQYLDVRMRATAGSSAYEKDGLLVIAQTDDDSSTAHGSGIAAARDCVGVGARGYISTGVDGRVWGLNAYGWCKTGATGEVTSIEANLMNEQTAVSVVGDQNQCIGLKLTTTSTAGFGASNAGTAAIHISTGSGSGWYKGIYAETADFVNDAVSSFIELNTLFKINRLGQVAIGGEDIEGKLMIQGNDADLVIRTNNNSTSGAWINFQEATVRNWSFGMDEVTGRMRLTTVDGVTVALAATGVLEMSPDNNIGINGYSVGGGDGVVFIANATTVPVSNPTGGFILYAEGGVAKIRQSDGTIVTITNDT